MRLLELHEILVSLLFLLISGGSLIVQCHNIHLKLVEYSNPDDKLASGLSCDKTSSCDPRFIICMKRRQSEPSCTILHGNTPKGYFIDKTNVLFDEKFGEVKNLYSAKMNETEPIPESIFLRIHVHDDETTWKTIGYFQTNLHQSDVYSMNFSKSTQKGFLKVQYWFTCSDRWYGQRCEKFCSPSLYERHRYGCHNESGEHVCEKGFSARLSNGGWVCDMRSPCLLNSPCQFSSKCEITPPSSIDKRPYRCHCPSHLTGQDCQNVRVPCREEICLNGGKCYLDGIQKTHCACPPKFKGPFCEEVTWKDENTILGQCATSTKNVTCLNNGRCLPQPLVAEETCFCPHGFGGSQCEMKVTWRDSYNEIQLWTDIVRSYTEVVRETRAPLVSTISSEYEMKMLTSEIFNTDNDKRNVTFLPQEVKTDEFMEILHYPRVLLVCVGVALVSIILFLIRCLQRHYGHNEMITYVTEEEVYKPTVVYSRRNVLHETNVSRDPTECSQNVHSENI